MITARILALSGPLGIAGLIVLAMWLRETGTALL
jgi:hypothetical protein